MSGHVPLVACLKNTAHGFKAFYNSDPAAATPTHHSHHKDIGGNRPNNSQASKKERENKTVSQLLVFNAQPTGTVENERKEEKNWKQERKEREKKKEKKKEKNKRGK